jgi:predicted N-formylglutamate amidohydrolase
VSFDLMASVSSNRDKSGAAMHKADEPVAPVRVFNAKGRGPFVLAVDHASNRIPEPYGTLGLTPIQRLMHIAWDPGAFDVALRLSDMLDVPLVASTVSRLVVDCNRAPDAADLVPRLAERTEIPGNLKVTDADRIDRIARYHSPFHAALALVLAERPEAALIAVHSFTPVFKGKPRPWPVGILPGADPAFSERLAMALRAGVPDLNLGWNEPYRSGLGVTYTLDHHGRDRRATMLEIRHDEILSLPGIALWSGRLGAALHAAL